MRPQGHRRAVTENPLWFLPTWRPFGQARKKSYQRPRSKSVHKESPAGAGLIEFPWQA